jgi:integrase
MNAATARTKAGAWLNKVHDGTDPAGEREAAKKVDAMRFHIAVEQYLAKQRAEVRESTFVDIESYLTKAKYFGALHKKPLAKITHSDVSQCVDAIRTKPSRRQAQKRLSALFVWAMRKGHATENPVIRCEAIKLKSRDRVLDKPNPHQPPKERDYPEIRAVWNACGDDDLGRIIRLLLLTGCRAKEIGQLRWSEINLDVGTVTLPPERTKNGREHVLPLSPLALAIIEKVEKVAGRDFLFGKRATGFTAWPRPNHPFVTGLGLEHWTIHDLRRTAATHMAELGIQPHVVEAVLNHVSGHKAGVAGVYNYAAYAREMRNALAVWSEHIVSITTGSVPKVVQLPTLQHA